ncbi:MAG: peptide ABC transporter substrate-binding protein [Verrucomicrobia bacterium]|nr:peptide ABC transporter substrate-binding protein [Verrucomicrobiota bacterium]
MISPNRLLIWLAGIFLRIRVHPCASVVLLLGALLAGCGKPESRVAVGLKTQELHLGNGTEPQDLDPQIVTGVSEHNIMSSLIEGLMNEDPKTLSPVPGVAERWDVSADGTAYTFHLRANARWSDGVPVTAQDFVRSYQRALMPALANEYAYMLYAMKGAEEFNKGKLTDFAQVGVHARDGGTLEIQLTHPVPYFLSLLNHYSWWPVNIAAVERHGGFATRGNRWTRPENYVGNGPFVLESWRIGHAIVVRRNTNYWDAANVRLQRIHFYGIESADTEERAFRAGQLHVTYNPVPPAKMSVYRERNPQFLRVDPYLGTYFYRFNVRKPPLDNPLVRRALALAIDRAALCETVLRGGQLPARCFTPADTAGYTARANLTGNAEDARRLLAQAGFAEGKNFPKVEILFNTSEAHRAIAEAIQQMWRKELGIEVTLVNQEWKVYLDTEKKGDYFVSRAGWIGDYADPSTFLETFTADSGNNRTGWSDKKYDALLAAAAREPDTTKRNELFQEAEAILMTAVPIMPIYFYTRPYLRQPMVRGWEPTLLDHHPWKHVWLESP